MPIYEYQCTQCGKPLEVFQKISEAPLTECPVCGQHALKKLISSTSFQLKGTGWYVTDIRDKNKPKPSTDTDTKGSDTTAKQADKTESKPAAESKQTSTTSTTASSTDSSSSSGKKE